MKDKQINCSINDIFTRYYTKELEKSIHFNNSKLAQTDEYVESIVSQKLKNILSEKIEEIQKDIDENTIISISKKLGYKINTQRLKKAEADFKLRNIMTLIFKKKSFKNNLEKRLAIPNLFYGSIFKETDEDIYIKLEELIRQATIEELFYQVKKNEYILNNISFEVREQSRIKSAILKRVKNVKGSWKGIIFDIIKNVIVKLIVNYIVKTQNRRIKNSCYYFA